MSMDGLVRDLMGAMRGKPKPEAYDTQATVTRVDGDTLWVHIPGGVDETPVRRTIDASVGDEIQVRVSGGRAYAIGNATAPPTDDRQANIATGKAERAQGTANDALESLEVVNAKIRTLNANVANVGILASTAQATADGANSMEQLIYKSAVSGTTSMTAPTSWITATGDTQNAWRARRPTYSSSYPVLFVATQRRTVGGTVTCTTPVIDQTTTVIDGGHISTGTIDADRINTTALMAKNLKATGKFEINNGVYYLKQTTKGFSFGSLLEDDNPQAESTEIRANASGGITLKTVSTDITLNSSAGGGINLSTDNLGAVTINGGLVVQKGGGTTANGGPVVGCQTKTVTGTTTAAGNVSLNLNADTYGVLCVTRTDDASICTAYRNANGVWIAHVTGIGSSATPVASTSVTLKVDYYGRGIVVPN